MTRYDERASLILSHLVAGIFRVEGQEGRELLLDPCCQMEANCQWKIFSVDDILNLEMSKSGLSC